MKKKTQFLLTLVLICTTAIPNVHAQRRYKHLKHARTLEGHVFSSQPLKHASQEAAPLHNEIFPSVTVEAFAEIMTQPKAEEFSALASGSDFPTEILLTGSSDKESKAHRKAEKILHKAEKTMAQLPFAAPLLAKADYSRLSPQKPQVNGLRFIIIGCILLGAALIFGIVGLALSIVLALSGTFPWTLIFNYIGLLLFFAGAALLTVGIIFRIKEKRASN